MLVSDNRKLVFVHIQKTGGSTVTRLLEEKVPDVYKLGARHEFANEGRKKLRGWDDYFKFAFVRNPWDRLVSWYSMIVRAQSTGNRSWNALWSYVYNNSSTFEEFIRNCSGEVEVEDGVFYSFAYNQLDYLTDERGNLLVDFIGRLETFEDDMREVADTVGMTLESETIPRKNRAPHRHYSTFYNRETETIVRERFKKDIEYFGYEFERPDTYQGVTFTPEEFFRLERQVQSLKGRLAEEDRRRKKQVQILRNELTRERRKNEILAGRLQSIQASKSWKVLNQLASIRGAKFNKGTSGE